ncbi:hypothetical protein N3K66_004934 [Trichothecium roseum]|uniref:Uncharacterized protein n=1 Tax=Trichothecium roseum TaxID=47278 RepID=A0ACC0V375_9HYPO|nr:hypothetical protein N3K66_004934 [Trichothecium roseum]
MSPAATTMTAWSAHPSGIILTGPPARPAQPQPQPQPQQPQGRKQERTTAAAAAAAASTATTTRPRSLPAQKQHEPASSARPAEATPSAPSELPTPTQSPPPTVAPAAPAAPAAEKSASILYDYIIFYRWLSPDGAYERGRVMARLVAEVMEKTAATRQLLSQTNPTVTTTTTTTNTTNTTTTATATIAPPPSPPPPPPSPPAAATRPGRHSIWLDQREIQRSAAPRDVVGKIAHTFRLVDQVIILAAPGDWARFANDDDIHRWEWELSLRSVWVLQYGLPEQGKALSGEELAAGLGAYNPRLAELARKKKVNVRVITMDNLDVVLREIAEAS